MDKSDKIDSVKHKIAKSAKYLSCGQKGRDYIHKLATTLKSNQWIHSGTDVDLDKLILPDSTIEHIDMKPKGLYTSKGDWLYHDVGSPFGNITLLEVDYTNIMVITSIEELVDFTNKYAGYIELDEDVKMYRGIQWHEIYKQYSGIVIAPNMSILHHGDNEYLKFGWTLGWDVSTLCIWNKDCIVNHKKLINKQSNDCEKVNKTIHNIVEQIITKL